MFGTASCSPFVPQKNSWSWSFFDADGRWPLGDAMGSRKSSRVNVDMTGASDDDRRDGGDRSETRMPSSAPFAA